MLLGLLLLLITDTYAVVTVHSVDESIRYADSIEQKSLNTQVNRQGQLRLAASGQFHHHNPFLSHGRLSAGAALAYDTLLVPCADDANTYYGLLAQSISYNDRAIRIVINKAYFHDGQLVTAEDVVNSLKHLIDNGPFKWQVLQQYALTIRAIDAHTVSIASENKIPFAVLLTLGQAPIAKCFDPQLCAQPIGSGPYKLHSSQTSRWVEWTFDTSYWAKNHLVNMGRYNFTSLRFQYYLHPFSAFNGFKLGEYDIRRELYYEQWHNLQQYAQQHPSLVLHRIPNNRPIAMQGWAFNLHKKTWQDIRLRQALSILFPFSSINHHLFQGEYLRLQSYFTNTPLGSTTTPYENVVDLLHIEKLLQESGYVMRQNQWVHPDTNQVLRLQIVVPDRQLEKIATIYAKSCQDLGIPVTIRRIDSTNYLSSLKRYDYDLAYWQFPPSLSNLHTLEHVFLSNDYAYSYSHVTGLHDSKLSDFIQAIAQSSPTQRPLVYGQLDRYLMEQYYTISFWYPPNERIAYWKGICHSDHPSQLRSYYHWWQCQ